MHRVQRTTRFDRLEKGTGLLSETIDFHDEISGNGKFDWSFLP
jgi:hypothetical protein